MTRNTTQFYRSYPPLKRLCLKQFPIQSFHWCFCLNSAKDETKTTAVTIARDMQCIQIENEHCVSRYTDICVFVFCVTVSVALHARVLQCIRFRTHTLYLCICVFVLRSQQISMYRLCNAYRLRMNTVYLCICVFVSFCNGRSRSLCTGYAIHTD